MTESSPLFESVPIESVRPHPTKAKLVPPDEVWTIALRMKNSLTIGDVPIVDKDGCIIAGVGAYQAALLMGWPTINVIRLGRLDAVTDPDAPGERS